MHPITDNIWSRVQQAWHEAIKGHVRSEDAAAMSRGEASMVMGEHLGPPQQVAYAGRPG